MNVGAIYQQLGLLLAHAPDLRSVDDSMQTPAETLRWLAKAAALVESMPGISIDGPQLDLAVQSLIRTQGRAPHPTQIMMILNRVLARAELQSPAQNRGAFISAGDGFDSIAALSKILSTAEHLVWRLSP